MVPPSRQGKSKARSQSTTFSNKSWSRIEHVTGWLHMHACSVAQSCLVICDLMEHSPPGSSVHRILQARILEWVALPFSRGSSHPQELNPHLLQWQADFFFTHRAACEEALTLCRIIHKFLLASREGCFWPYSEVHHGSSDYQCKQMKRDFEVGMWHPSEGII